MSGQARLRRSLLLGLLSFCASLLLILPLLKLAGVGLAPTLRILTSAHIAWLGAVVAVTAVNTLLAAEKWRIANRVGGSTPPSLAKAFSLTAVGVGLGQVLPVQLSTALARAVGARALGEGTMLRAGATSLLEQVFDVAVFSTVALVSAATLVAGGGVGLWVSLVLAALPVGWLAAPRGAKAVATAIGGLLRRSPLAERSSRILAGLALLSEIDPRLARRLFLLSVLRYGALVGLANAITATIGLRVDPWQLAQALPFAVIAIAVIATPAGLGVNEWTMSGALIAFGATPRTAVEWVVLSRIVSTLASTLIGVAGLALALGLWRTIRPRAANVGAMRLRRRGEVGRRTGA